MGGWTQAGGGAIAVVQVCVGWDQQTNQQSNIPTNQPSTGLGFYGAFNILAAYNTLYNVRRGCLLAW